MVKQGDRVKVDGREACVVSSWGQGKHTAWALDDGTTVLDLEKKVESGAATIIVAPEPEPAPTRSERRSAFRNLPKETDDHEE
jgi:hypothetical protein